MTDPAHSILPLDPLTWPSWLYFAVLVTYFPIRAAVMVAAVSVFTFKTAFGRRRRVFRVPYFAGQVRAETIAAVKIVLFDAFALSAIHASGLFRDRPATAFGVGLTVVGLYLWVETWYYFAHRLMHTTPLYLLHAQHHTARVTHPVTFLSFSLPERALQGTFSFLVPAIVSNWVPMPFLGFVGYAIIFVGLDLFGHMNVEVFPMGYARSWVSVFFFSPTYHSLHHARYRGHYALFCPGLDRLFGSYFEDYPDVFELAVNGNGPASFDYRGPPRSAT